MNELKKYAFSDLYDISSGLSSTKEQAGHGAPFASFSTVFNNIFLPDELPDLMDTSPQEQETYSIKAGDILITRTSETVDELAMSCVALKDYPGATYSGFVKRLRPKTEGIVYDRFMAFYLRSKYFRKVIDCNTIMTLRASFNEDIFSFLELYLPDYETQVRAGDFLYNIERVIQNNKKINDNLQQQLDLLFDYLFNQKYLQSSFGHGTLSDIASITMGQSPDGSTLNDSGDGVNFYQGSTDFNTVFPTPRVYTTAPSRMATKMDTLLSVRAPVGAINIAFETCCIGRGLAAIHGLYDNNSFVRHLLQRSHWYFERINSNGTTFGSLTKDALYGFPVILPPKDSIQQFEHRATIYEEQIYKNEKENRTLKQLRDWLLPMLMNGQVDIAD